MDQKLLFLINREWISAAADRWLALASSWDAWFLPVLCAGAALWLFGGFQMRAFIALAVLAAAVNDGLVSNSLKHLINRPRPYQELTDVRMVDLAKGQPRLLQVFKPVRVHLSRPDPAVHGGRSFPSSHTMNVVGTALTAALCFGRRAWWAFLLAAVVAYSRIYTGSHWPSDVLTSIFLSLGVTAVVLAGAQALWAAQASARWPAMYERHPRLYPA